MTYRYRVAYRRDNAPWTRIHRLTVTARDPDEARTLAAIRDPHFLCAAGYPRRAVAA